MVRHHIDKQVRTFLNDIFCVVGRNSPYQVNDFARVFLDAMEHEDFTNNTCVRVKGPTGETAFSRLKNTSFDEIKSAFCKALERIFKIVKCVLRNRNVALAFDITDEPYYGKIKGLYIHPQKPVRGSTGCFKFITMSVVDRENKFILGSLPVRIGADIVELVMELIEQGRRFIRPEICLFDRGFDDYRLINALQNTRVRYQILWRKNKWTSEVFKTMKRGEKQEIRRQGTYSKDKTKHKVNIRFVLIKKYKRHKKGKAYDWVFATNTRQKWQHNYVDKYRKRWGIETAFRVLDNIRIRTTTKNEIIRYSINILCCLVYNLWKLTNAIDDKITLKNFVHNVVEHIKLILQPKKIYPPDG